MHGKELEKLREDFIKAVEALERRLSRIERILKKLTLDIEEEARSIIRYRLKTEHGLEVELSTLTLPDLEINVYGCTGDVCVVGEASVRAGSAVLRGLLEKLEILRSKYPDKLRRRTILVVYTSLATPDLIEEARKRGVWVLKATGDYYKPVKLELEETTQHT